SKKDEMKDKKNNNVSAEELTELMNHAVEMEKEGQKQDRMLTWMIVPIVIAVAILVKLNTASSVLGSAFVGCFVAFPVVGIYLLLRSQHDKDGQRIYSVFVVIGIGILIGVLQVIGCKASWLIWGAYVVLSLVIGILNK
ncbi:MAG: hypothetical protein PHE09_19165, partial [Oscillospiraceae bacterium]|nr:hypothetical protein [Oscillospiraceae bacterium]